MSPNEYQKAALRTANKEYQELSTKDNKWPTFAFTLLNGALGLTGESGEVADIFKKWMFQGHPLNKEHIAKELGDILWYVAISADAIGYPLEDIMILNIDKLKARYPDGFNAERSLHRQDGDV